MIIKYWHLHLLFHFIYVFTSERFHVWVSPRVGLCAHGLHQRLFSSESAAGRARERRRRVCHPRRACRRRNVARSVRRQHRAGAAGRRGSCPRPGHYYVELLQPHAQVAQNDLGQWRDEELLSASVPRQPQRHVLCGPLARVDGICHTKGQCGLCGGGEGGQSGRTSRRNRPAGGEPVCARGGQRRVFGVWLDRHRRFLFGKKRFRVYRAQCYSFCSRFMHFRSKRQPKLYPAPRP